MNEFAWWGLGYVMALLTVAGATCLGYWARHRP